MTTFTWTVTRLNCYSQAKGQTDVVFTVHWACFGTDGTYDGAVYSICSVPAPTDSFTPYASLTQDQVLGWIWANGVDKLSVEAGVQNKINNQINSSVVSPPLPWSS